MASTSSPGRIAAALGICMHLVFAATALSAHAEKHASTSPAAPKQTAECAQARQFAWFQRQLRHSDGDNEPLVPPTPAECIAKPVHAESPGAGAASAQAAAEGVRGAPQAY